MAGRSPSKPRKHGQPVRTASKTRSGGSGPACVFCRAASPESKNASADDRGVSYLFNCAGGASLKPTFQERLDVPPRVCVDNGQDIEGHPALRDVRVVPPRADNRHIGRVDARDGQRDFARLAPDERLDVP